MQDTPSRSALRVALRRAAHQIFDDPPLVFEDPLAIRILGPHATELTRTPGQGRRPPLRPRTDSLALRAFLVARSRFTEDALARAVAKGTRQYVLLGAGLDTFAHRNPHPDLRVFELDHPATQGWKRDLLAHAGLPHPPNLHYIPTDLEARTLPEALHPTPYDPRQPTLFAALGLIPYLAPKTLQAILAFVAAQAPGSSLVFDYAQPPETLPAPERLAHTSLATRTRAAGEPFRLYLTPADIHAQLAAHHLALVEDLAPEDLNALYFTQRTDALHLHGSASRLLHADRPTSPGTH